MTAGTDSMPVDTHAPPPLVTEIKLHVDHLLFLPGKALAEFPVPAECRGPTLQLSYMVHPPIDHVLRAR